MSVVEVKCLNLQCDACGKFLTDEMGYQLTQSELEDVAYRVDDWLTFKGKHYCPKCCRYNNKGNIATKDGSIYDAETGRFVGYEREDY